MNRKRVSLAWDEAGNAAWWEKRREKLRQCHDDCLYNERSLDLCWHSICKSNRFKRKPLSATGEFPIPYTTIRHMKASCLEDKDLLIFHPKDFPTTEEIDLLSSTLTSFKHHLGRLIAETCTDWDRERAHFDQLSFPVINELLNAIRRYISRYQLLIPKRAIPDYEMLEMSLATLHRAKQFFEYFLYTKSPESANYLRLSSVLQQDSENIDTVITVVHMVMHKSDKPDAPKKKRQSESVLSNDQKRIRATLSGPDMVREVHTNPEPRTNIQIKPEVKPFIFHPMSNLHPDSKPFVMEGIPQYNQSPMQEESQTQLVIKPEKIERCVVPEIAVKHEPIEKWMEVDFRSLSEF